MQLGMHAIGYACNWVGKRILRFELSKIYTFFPLFMILDNTRLYRHILSIFSTFSGQQDSLQPFIVQTVYFTNYNECILDNYSLFILILSKRKLN